MGPHFGSSGIHAQASAQSRRRRAVAALAAALSAARHADARRACALAPRSAPRRAEAPPNGLLGLLTPRIPRRSRRPRRSGVLFPLCTVGKKTFRAMLAHELRRREPIPRRQAPRATWPRHQSASLPLLEDTARQSAHGRQAAAHTDRPPAEPRRACRVSPSIEACKRQGELTDQGKAWGLPRKSTSGMTTPTKTGEFEP